MSVSLIIPAAGNGSRFGGTMPKQFLPLRATPVIVRTISVFARMPEIAAILVAVNPAMIDIATEMIEDFHPRRVIITAGGEQRQESIAKALQHPAIAASDIVLVHDAVRPFVSTNMIREVIAAAEEFGAAIPGQTPTDTIKQITRDGFVEQTYNRSLLRAVQTPQAFRRELLLEAYNTATIDHFVATDDASVVEYAGFPVKVIDGDPDNIKITTMADWERAEKIVERMMS